MLDYQHACQNFLETLAIIEKENKRQGLQIPSTAQLSQAQSAFWALDAVISTTVQGKELPERQAFYAKISQVIGPVLYRSRFFWRSRFKPQGYAGDFQLIDDTYFLESMAGRQSTQSSISNCLDAIIASFASVESLWERRHRLAQILRDFKAEHGQLALLDIACGSARYISDFMAEQQMDDSITITCFDQDPSALDFCRQTTLSHLNGAVQYVCAPVKAVAQQLAGSRYDVIISSGLFDYLPDQQAHQSLQMLRGLLKDNGQLVMTNFTPEDRSAIAKEWTADWHLILRDEAALGRVFGPDWSLSLTRSRNGSLIFAVAKPSPHNEASVSTKALPATAL